MTNPAEVLEPAACNTNNVTNANWQAYPRVYAHYDGMLGPFRLDACSDMHRCNAMHPTYWTAAMQCTPPTVQLSNIAAWA